MKRRYGNICSLLIMGILMAVSARGQNITSTLVGQVSDPSGSGVPNARITVTNINTGISTAGVTSSSGSYSVADLLAGMYTVSAEAPGFSVYKESGIALQSAETARVDITLKVGSVSQTVEVTGAAPLIQLDSATIGGNLTTEQVRNLPAAYETVVSLYSSVPGATTGTSVSNPQFDGTTHWGALNYSLNGISVDDISNGGGAYAYGTGPYAIGLINLPQLDTLQEFRVVVVNANAEFRDVASVMMVTKQGSNEFHGDLYELFQNADLNANTYLLNAAGQPRAKGNVNQFGGSIGGPIIKNKVFFFFAPNFLRQVTAATAQLELPSTAMTTGNFSAVSTQLYNPFTGQPFPGNQIPSTMITSQAQRLLKYLPAPTIGGSLGLPSGGTNYIHSVPLDNNMTGYTGRVDYQVRPSDSLFGVYTHSIGAPWNVCLCGPPQYGNASNFGFLDQSASLAETHTFNDTTLNDFRAAWYVHNNYRQGENADFNPQSLFPQLTPGLNRGLPTMSLLNYSTLFNDYGYGLGKRNAIYDTEFTDNFTKVLGNHSIKAGFDETGYKVFNKLGTGSLGSFSFSGVWTGNKGWPNQPHSQGNAFADFLLGTANAATESTISPDSEYHNRIYEAYVQDNWQATSHLTLYYGVRYMYQGAWAVRDNAVSHYDVTNNKIALPQNSATPTLPSLGNAAFYQAYLPYFETTSSIGLSTHYMHPSKNDWAPRVGFAYRPPFLNNTVIRGGYGVYYNFLIADFGIWDSLNVPFGSNTSTNSSKLPGAPTSTYLPDVTFASPFGSTNAVISLNPTLYYDQPDIKNSMTQQFNLSLEHQFHENWMGRVSYVGSVTQHIPWFESDINVPLVQTPNVSTQLGRPHQPWSTISSVRSGANQNFNQLQVETKRRYSNGMSFRAEYDWTRSLDDVEATGGPQRWYLPRLDYGNSTGIHTHTLVANYLYALPFGHGRTWLNNSSAMVNALAGGWQVSGITSYASGNPFSVGFNVPSSYIGWLGGRANRLPGVPLYVPHTGGHNVIKGVPWFNPAAFGPPTPWTWGTSGRNILWGPGSWNWDMSALKEIPVTQDLVKITFRADFLDAFNHSNLSGPNATVASTQYGGVAQPTAGNIYSASGNRIIQFGLRASF